MVEREPVARPAAEHAGDGHELGAAGVGRGGDGAEVGDDREVGDRHDAHARIVVGLAVGAELLQVPGGAYAGLLGELPRRRRVEVFVLVHEAAGNRPGPEVRRLAAVDQQDLELAVGDREHDDVDGDGEGRVLGGLVAPRAGTAWLPWPENSRDYVVMTENRVAITFPRRLGQDVWSNFRARGDDPVRAVRADVGAECERDPVCSRVRVVSPRSGRTQAQSR